MYTDDIMMFFKGYLDSTSKVRKLLDTLEQISGLRVNNSKVELEFGLNIK